MNSKDQKCTCFVSDSFYPHQVSPRPVVLYQYDDSIPLMAHIPQCSSSNGDAAQSLVLKMDESTKVLGQVSAKLGSKQNWVKKGAPE